MLRCTDAPGWAARPRGIRDVQLQAHKVRQLPLVVAYGRDVQVVPEGLAVAPVVEQLHLCCHLLVRHGLYSA